MSGASSQGLGGIPPDSLLNGAAGQSASVGGWLWKILRT